jgi:hypothetical protein
MQLKTGGGGMSAAMPLVFNVVPKRAGIIRVRLPITSADWSEHFIACAGNLQTCPRLHFFWIGTLSFNRSAGFLKNASRGMEVRVNVECGTNRTFNCNAS